MFWSLTLVTREILGVLFRVGFCVTAVSLLPLAIRDRVRYAWCLLWYNSVWWLALTKQALFFGRASVSVMYH